MDKLKPVLEHKFWILLFLALLLPTIGWFIASGSYAETIERRKSELDTAFNSVNFVEAKNPEWISHVKELVESEDTRLQIAQKLLSDKQKARQTWPPNLKSMMADVAFKGEVPAEALEGYRAGYELQLGRVEQILRPFDIETAEGVILYDRSSITHVPADIVWAERAPTAEELWNAQEDLWLTQALFESIAALNKGENKLSDSSVRQLVELHLRGGTRGYSGAGELDSSGALSDDASDMADSYPGSEYGGAIGGRGTGPKAPPVQFDLSDELGPDGSRTGGQFGGSAYLQEAANGTDGNSADDGGVATLAAPKRYVDDSDDLPFRTRAFVLGVMMDHRQLNNFLVQLSSSDWPLQIIRVNLEILNPDQLDGPRSPGMRGPGNYGSGVRGPRGFGANPNSAYESYESTNADGYMGGYSSPGTGFGSNSGFIGRPASGFNSSRRPGSGMRGTVVTRNPNADALMQKALQDPFIARVWVGGLITLFKPLQETDSAAEAAAVEKAADAELNGQNPAEPVDLNPGTEPESTTEPAPAAEPNTPAEPADAGPAAEPPAIDNGSVSDPGNPTDPVPPDAKQTPPSAPK